MPDPTPAATKPDRRRLAVDAATQADFVAALGEHSVIARTARIEVAGAMPVPEAEPEGVVQLLVLLVQLRRDQQLHRGDLLLRMPRKMVGIVAADEAGIGFCAGGARIHARIEGLGFSLAGLTDVVAFLGLGGADECGKGKREDKSKLHDRTGCLAAIARRGRAAQACH